MKERLRRQICTAMLVMLSPTPESGNVQVNNNKLFSLHRDTVLGLSLTALMQLINLKDERPLGTIVTDIQMNRGIDMSVHQILYKGVDLISLKT